MQNGDKDYDETKSKAENGAGNNDDYDLENSYLYQRNLISCKPNVVMMMTVKMRAKF